MTEQNPDVQVAEDAGPADASIVESVRAGAAPSYRSDAFFTDDNGRIVLQPASLPQLTMPELQGLSDPVVPEEGDALLYGIDEDAEADEEADAATAAAVERGQKVAEQWLEDSNANVNVSGQGSDAPADESA